MMRSYRAFLRTLLRNYLIGSVVAVLGVGGTLLFSTIHVTPRDEIGFSVILLFSLVSMFAFEFLQFWTHLKPIRGLVIRHDTARVEDIREAYIQLHRFPMLTVKRVLGPHMLGFTISGTLAALVFIQLKWISVPTSYVGIAILGCILIASMHAMMEFFFSTQAIQPMLHEVRSFAQQHFRFEPSLDGQVLVSIRAKFQLSAILIGVLPVLLFGLATQVHLTQLSHAVSLAFWRWALVVLLIGVGFALLGARLLVRLVQQPLEELLSSMRAVQTGRLDVKAMDTYSDEFSRLMSGFNHMVRGLAEREDLNSQLLNSYFATLAAALDARDPYTAGHSVRVAQYSVGIAERIGWSVEEINVIRQSALLHDIGKIGVRDSILLKDGKLSDEEMDQMKLHPVLGESILREVQPAEAMAALLPGVRSHHERYDGHGYPDGLSGEDIPLLGRIMAVADAFDAMTSDRPYRRGMPAERALTILEEGRWTQWDPQFAQIFIEWKKNEQMLDAEESVDKRNGDSDDYACGTVQTTGGK